MANLGFSPVSACPFFFFKVQEHLSYRLSRIFKLTNKQYIHHNPINFTQFLLTMDCCSADIGAYIAPSASTRKDMFFLFNEHS